MYYGIGTNRGEKVSDEDALPYAWGRIAENEQERAAFCHYIMDTYEVDIDPFFLLIFLQDMVDWYYSGDWVHGNEEGYNEHAL